MQEHGLGAAQKGEIGFKWQYKATNKQNMKVNKHYAIFSYSEQLQWHFPALFDQIKLLNDLQNDFISF